MITQGFFPTLIHAEDIKLDNQQIANDIVAWSKQDEGLKKTNVNGWHSQTNMHELPQFKPLSLSAQARTSFPKSLLSKLTSLAYIIVGKYAALIII